MAARDAGRHFDDAALPPGARSDDDMLKARVEDSQMMVLRTLTLSCAGDCADVRAVASGGRPPYTYEWEDGSTEPDRQLCLNESGLLHVKASDTAMQSGEFSYAGQTASVDVKAIVQQCTGPGKCDRRAPAGSFDPVVKWSWTGGGGGLITPLVGNLTDDNGDGVVDLLDTPDVVLQANDLIVLDGATGQEHFRIPGFGGTAIGGVTAALGDIDGDAKIDIVAVGNDATLAAFKGDGTRLWTGPAVSYGGGVSAYTSLSLADLDGDGSPEIIAGGSVYDARGVLKWSADATKVGVISTPTATDLDEDGSLEVVWGAAAYRHDGSVYYDNADVAGALTNAFPAIADLDSDQQPEVVVATGPTLFVLDARGKTLRSAALAGAFAYPPAIQDLDGDGKPEIMLSSGTTFTAFAGDLSIRWAMPIQDLTTDAAGTAFDFLGDGTAEAMYSDETTSWVFDGRDGHVVFRQPRISWTVIEYPSVADVDNDGSADILVVSQGIPTLQVLSDRLARWVPARRIMNQDTYHVTNINEDGTVPVHERPSWKSNNSFRAQAQVDANGAVCVPEPLDEP